MNLYLVQHGEPLAKEIDPERPLSERGKQEVAKVARFAAKNCSMSLSVIRHSGKLRALQTAAILAEEFGLPEPAVSDGLASLDDPGIWASALRDRTDNIMLVGHLPHLARLAGALLCGKPEAAPVGFQMGGITALAREEGRWSLQWQFVPGLLPG